MQTSNRAYTTHEAPLKPHVLLRSTRKPQTPNRVPNVGHPQQTLGQTSPPPALPPPAVAALPSRRLHPHPRNTTHLHSPPPALTCRPPGPTQTPSPRGDSIVREGGNIRGDVTPQPFEHLSVNSGLWTAGRGVGAERLDGAEAEEAVLCHAPATWWAGLPPPSASNP